MTYHEYVKERISIPLERDPEPFCPFSIGYCNDAYSEKCYGCEESRFAFSDAVGTPQNRCGRCGETFCSVSVLRHTSSGRPVEVYHSGRISFCPLCGEKLS